MSTVSGTEDVDTHKGDDAPVARLPLVRRVAYGVGHVLNDLCAAMWFSYLLVFLHQVVYFSNAVAGYLLLLGQVADALVTPVIGIASDRLRRGFCGRYGRRKSWHVIGTILVASCFPFFFNTTIGFTTDNVWVKFAYYSPFVIVFQIGWAATQINHLALIPDICEKKSQRVELNAIRYSFQVVSNILVYVCTWLMLRLNKTGQNDKITEADAPQFRNLSFILVGIGIVAVILFHIGTKEEALAPKADEVDEEGDASKIVMKPKDWFKEPQFYQVAVMYMCTRVTYITPQVYLPLYVTDSLRLQKVFIAIIPLVVFVSGFVTSIVMKPITKRLSLKAVYLIGGTFVVVSCLWLFLIAHFLPPPCQGSNCPSTNPEYQIFGAAVLVGVGGSSVLVASLAITAQMIGNHTVPYGYMSRTVSESGAFVYGIMSFCDKIFSGVVVAVIQNLQPCQEFAPCGWFYKYVVSTVPASFTTLALIVIVTLIPVKLGRLRKHQAAEDCPAKEERVFTIENKTNDVQNGAANGVVVGTSSIEINGDNIMR